MLNLIANATNSEKFAEFLFIAKTRVDAHRKNMIYKLDLASGGDLIKYAIDKKYKFNSLLHL
ncbi:LuxR C-terminal-related transcriptional regulator [Polaribacter filamentus]|uniref:LuxR C-terminal-related transcriptional regulator n=1 Tax=Polaribacter filamentus TaxID=53483 RepID=UPI0011B0667F